MAPAPVRLSARGRSVLVAAAALLVAARLFGSVELAGLAAAAGLAVAAATVQLRAVVPYTVERYLEASRVTVGEPVAVRLRFENVRARRGRHVALATDALPGGSARCLVDPLGPGDVAEVAYGAPTGRRGIVVIGPAELAVSDPLGLAEVGWTAATAQRLVVHPRIEPVVPFPGVGPAQVEARARRTPELARGGEFHTLRRYEQGDDLRRVHWRSTAKVGELMLRQDERRRRSTATVLVDTRAPTHTPASFERALSVAASVTAALMEEGRPLRFVTTGGFEAEAADRVRFGAVLDFLAAVEPETADGFPRVHAALRRAPPGPLVAVLAGAAPEDMARLGMLRHRLGTVVLAVVTDGPTGPSRRVSGAVVVAVTGDVPLARAWNDAAWNDAARNDAARNDAARNDRAWKGAAVPCPAPEAAAP